MAARLTPNMGSIAIPIGSSYGSFAHDIIIILFPALPSGRGERRMTNPGAGMPCPVCAVPLVMSDRQGVEIDYCPQCRGVWLDRGELDKIIERSRGPEPAPQPAPQPAPHQQNYAQPPAGQSWGREHQGYGKGYPKRRKSFLEELFD